MKFIYRVFCIVLTVLILLPCLSTAFFASESDDYAESLWAKKREYERSLEVQERLGIYHYRKVFDYFPYVLLYLENPEAFGMTIIEIEVEGLVICSPYLHLGSNIWTFPTFLEFETLYESTGDGGYEIPHLVWLVREMNISKEQLIAANERMKTDPYYCRELFTMFTDSEFEEVWSGVYPEQYALDEYMIDALYVERFDEACSLLHPHRGFRWDGEWLWPLYVTGGEDTGDEDVVRYHDWDRSKFEEKNISKSVFLRYLNVMYEKHANNRYIKWDDLYDFANSLEESPKAGDETAVYALVFTLCALPFAGLCVYGWKKRRRAI